MVETLRSLVWFGEAPITSSTWPGLLLTGKRPKRLLCPSILVSAASNALDCVRLAQTATTPEARKTWSDLAKTWLRFASDLEANECLLDEWGNPRPKKAQTEE